MAKAELGNLTVLYSPPSAANVNCENPRRKPVSHLPGPNWGYPSAFSGMLGKVFLRPPQATPPLHRMCTGLPAFRLARKWTPGAKSRERKKILPKRWT